MVLSQIIAGTMSRKKLTGILSEALGYSLFGLLDLTLTLYIASQVGIFVVLIFIMISNLLLFFWLQYAIRRIFKTINKAYINGLFPEKEFHLLVAYSGGLPFVLAPGFCTTLIGFILCGPLGAFYGKYLSKKLSLDWPHFYEYSQFDSIE
jgi:UPF0716 family protein affecting phage T7 exclusion